MIDAIFMMIAGIIWILLNIILYYQIMYKFEMNPLRQGYMIMIIGTIYFIINSVFAFFFIAAGYHDYILMRG